MTTIIQKASQVRRLIGIATKQATSLHAKYRVLAVTTLWHAASHGDPSLLNAFFGSLSENHKAGLKRWIVKEILLSTGLTNVSDGWVTFSKDEFKVKKDTVDIRMKTEIHLEEHQDESEFGAFWRIDTDKEANPFNNIKLLEQLHNLLKKAQKGQTEGQVDATLVDALDRAVSLVDTEANRIVSRTANKAPNFAPGMAVN